MHDDNVFVSGSTEADPLGGKHAAVNHPDPARPAGFCEVAESAGTCPFGSTLLTTRLHVAAALALFCDWVERSTAAA